MAIHDMQVMAIKSEGCAAWTVVTVEFQWLDSASRATTYLPK